MGKEHSSAGSFHPPVKYLAKEVLAAEEAVKP